MTATIANATCPRCQRQPVTVYVYPDGTMCGQCARKAPKRYR